jgi:hypothetical protein
VSEKDFGSLLEISPIFEVYSAAYRRGDSMRFDNSEIAFSHLDDSALKRATFLFSLMANRFLGSIGPKFIHLMLTLRVPIIVSRKINPLFGLFRLTPALF